MAIGTARPTQESARKMGRVFATLSDSILSQFPIVHAGGGPGFLGRPDRQSRFLSHSPIAGFQCSEAEGIPVGSLRSD
jgi:hypothetical protein